MYVHNTTKSMIVCVCVCGVHYIFCYSVLARVKVSLTDTVIQVNYETANSSKLFFRLKVERYSTAKTSYFFDTLNVFSSVYSFSSVHVLHSE